MVSPSAVTCRQLGRAYGAIQALVDVDLDVRQGEIHSLVGENGAGKSTLVGILAGRVSPSAGSVEVFGQQLTFGDPRASRRLGIATIFQELTMVPALTAVANVFLGQEVHRGFVLDDSAMRQSLLSLSMNLGVSVHPNERAGRLPVSEQQLLEILRGLTARAKLLILDEPTAALAEHEREVLYEVLHRLRRDGVTTLLVSHNLDEVLDLSDTITVLRNGRRVAGESRAAWTKSSLVSSMLGHAVERNPSADRTAGSDVVLDAQGITVRGAIDNVDLRVCRGEIVGLAGLVGSGRTTVLRALAGLVPEARGMVATARGSARLPLSTRRAHRLGLVLIPEDRKTGLIRAMSVADNITLGAWNGATRFGLIDRRRQHELTRSLAERFGFSRAPGERVDRLSGGNQQKVLIAKAVRRSPMVLLADEPTRGIDVGAKAEVLSTLTKLATSGLSVIVASSELEEVLQISDRILVMHAGRVVGESRRGDSDWSVAGVLRRVFDVSEQEAN